VRAEQVWHVRRTLLVLVRRLIRTADRLREVANLLLSSAVSRSGRCRAHGTGCGPRAADSPATHESLLLRSARPSRHLLAVGSLAALRSLGREACRGSPKYSIDARRVAVHITVVRTCRDSIRTCTALRASRLDLHASLKDAARGSGGQHGMGSRQQSAAAAVAAELALSLVLLIGAGLLIRSFAHLINVPTGFNSKENVLTLSLSMIGRKYGKCAGFAIDTYRACGSAEQLPGVIAAGAIRRSRSARCSHGDRSL